MFGVCYNKSTHDCCLELYIRNYWRECNGTCYDALRDDCCQELSIRNRLERMWGFCYQSPDQAVVAGKFIIQRQSPVVAEPSWKKIFGDHATGSVTITGMSPAATRGSQWQLLERVWDGMLRCPDPVLL